MKCQKSINIISLLVSISSIGCSNNNGSNHFAKLDSLQSYILGRWGGLGEDSPVLEIKADSIYYYQEHKSYPYKMNGRDLTIERPSQMGILKNVTVDMDTMIFYDQQGLKIKAYRFK